MRFFHFDTSRTSSLRLLLCVISLPVLLGLLRTHHSRILTDVRTHNAS